MWNEILSSKKVSRFCGTHRGSCPGPRKRSCYPSTWPTPWCCPHHLLAAVQEGGHRRGAAAPAPGLGRGGQGAGFIRLDRIRMLLEKILTFILLFNYSIYIILVLKIHNSIISALKIMNLKILVLNFSKCIIPEYVRINNSFFPVSPHWWLCWLYDCTLRCTLGLCLIYLKHIYFTWVICVLRGRFQSNNYFYWGVRRNKSTEIDRN